MSKVDLSASKLFDDVDQDLSSHEFFKKERKVHVVNIKYLNTENLNF